MATSVLIKSAIAEIRRHPGRLAAVLLAIVISVGYLSATLVFLSTETHAIQDSVTARTGGSDVVVTDHGAGPKAVEGLRDRAAKLPGAAAAEVSYDTYAPLGNGSSSLELQSLPTAKQLRSANLKHGSWPDKNKQIAIGNDTAKKRGVKIGDRITLQNPNPRQTSSSKRPTKLTVTGLTHQSQSLLSEQSQTAFVPASYFANQHTSDPDLLVVANGSHSPEKLAAQVKNVAGKGLSVQTADAYGQQQVKNYMAGLHLFQALLLTFGGIALLVGGILITNTFLILLVQRRRQIGLLRAVGASGGQVRLSILAEAAAVGLVGAALGIATGIGVAAGATAVAGSLHTGLTVPPTVILAGLVGVAVTLGAALIPAGRATQVSPLAALNPVPGEQAARRISVARLVTSLLLGAGGATFLVVGLGNGTNPLLMAVLGSMLLAISCLVATGIFLPGVLRVLGWPVRIFGPTGRIAAANTVRHPGRAAATAMSIMIAVGLIVTLQVGSASIKATMNDNLNKKYPTDITLATQHGRLPAHTVHRVASVSGITATHKVSTGTAKIAGEKIRLESPGSGAHTVVRRGADKIKPDHIVLSPDQISALELHDGQTIRVSGSEGQHRLTVTSSNLAPSETGVITSSTLKRLAGDSSVGALWAKTQPGADVTAVQADLDKIVSPKMDVGGSLSDKAAYDDVLDTLLTIATALLGVAVLIALIGIGNTLGLSVAERTRESALLRALGLNCGQLRLMLAIEAVLLAIGGSLVGIVAGAFFGWIGTNAMVAEAGFDITRFSMSVPQTVAVAAIAIAAGVLASILPGRRAAKTAPVQALTAE